MDENSLNVKVDDNNFRDFSMQPTSILGVFTHYLKCATDGQRILVQGVFLKNEIELFEDGFYWDILKSDRDDLSIKIKTAPRIRELLQSNTQYFFMGIIEENIRLLNPELVFVVYKIIGKLDVLQSFSDSHKLPLNLSKGFSNKLSLKMVIKRCLEADKCMNLLIISGEKKLIPDTFTKAIGGAIKFLTISVLGCSSSNKTELLNLINDNVGKNYDAIILVGTWWNNTPWACNCNDIGQQLTKTNSLIITVYGHNKVKTLLDQISDKRYRSFRHFGAQLRVLIDGVVKSL